MGCGGEKGRKNYIWNFFFYFLLLLLFINQTKSFVLFVFARTGSDRIESNRISIKFEFKAGPEFTKNRKDCWWSKWSSLMNLRNLSLSLSLLEPRIESKEKKIKKKQQNNQLIDEGLNNSIIKEYIEILARDSGNFFLIR